MKPQFMAAEASPLQPACGSTCWAEVAVTLAVSLDRVMDGDGP